MIDLWEFQREDVEKLAELPGALNTNDMGTGKTREAVALDLLHRERYAHVGSLKTLVVAPLNTLEPTWVEHFRELAPHLRISLIDPKNRGALLRGYYDVYIVHWEALRLMPELREIGWLHIIADEVHRAKNRKAQQTRALKALKATFKTGLSGTPVTNKPEDYWSVLNWLYPRQWRSYWKFYELFVDYKVKYPEGYKISTGPKNIPQLLAEIDAYTVRHLKKAKCCHHHPNGVLPFLPDKYYTEIKVELLPLQRRAYTQMKRDMIAWVGAQESTPVIAPVVVAKLIRLQQFADAYCEIDPDTGRVLLSEPSAKLDVLMQLLEDNPNEQIVVFSQFSQMINLLGKRLEKAGITRAIYTGETPKSQRATLVREFQSGSRRVFAGTIKAGGVGLDLYTASTVVFLDREWSPAENVQAEDRLHRAGQRNPVQIIDLRAQNTVDLGRHQQLVQKWTWIRQMLGDDV